MSSKKSIKKGNKKGHLEWKETIAAEIEIAINIKYQDINGKECVVAGPVAKVPIKIKVPAE